MRRLWTVIGSRGRSQPAKGKQHRTTKKSNRIAHPQQGAAAGRARIGRKNSNASFGKAQEGEEKGRRRQQVVEHLTRRVVIFCSAVPLLPARPVLPVGGLIQSPFCPLVGCSSSKSILMPLPHVALLPSARAQRLRR